MGCWNGTCGLTNLPILEDQEMYVFPIVETAELDTVKYGCQSCTREVRLKNTRSTCS